MTEPSSRYARSKLKRESVERHNAIAGRLGANVRQEFDRALEDLEEPTPCIAGGIPSAWTDWDAVEENREYYESEMPSRQAARLLCEGCPLLEICLPAALARGERHGIWSGVRVDNGKVLD